MEPHPNLDEQIGSQGCPLRQPEQNTSDLSSGDANSNLSRPHGLSNVPYVHRFDGQNLGDDRNAESGKTVQSKASVGAEDDFDVNEYFARLQGTRYVSAPLNSAQKENIGAEAEENLEEINLNEPEKAAADDVPHSLTADIAQNFSQLPTVLPQVASAVFSSFSNMLSMKSREHTPDEGGPVPDYRSHEPVDSGVPLMGVPDVVKDVAPQPKEPPTIGTASNYRITTRKKMYAPIPGLRSGDMSHNLPTYNPPMGLTNAPSFFTPDTSDATDNNNFNMSTEVAQSKLDYNIFGKTVAQNVESNVAVETTQNIPQEFSINVDQKQLAVSSALHDQTKSISFIEDKNKCDPDNIQSTETLAKCNEMDLIQPQKSHEMIINTPPAQSVMPASASNVSVIPPPPMFSNLPRSEGQNNLRSVLPPSIARRISASNPVIKPQAPPSLVPLHNIFVPDSNISTQSQPELNVANPEKSSAIPLMSNQLTNAPILNNNMTKFESKQLPPAEIFSVPSQYIPPTLFQAANTSTPAPGEVQHTKDSRKEFSAKLPFNISQPSDLSVTHLSQLNLDPPITNLAEELTSEIPLRAPNSDIFLRNISDITDIPSTSVPLPPPPVFINPNDISALSLKSKESRKPADQCENNAATDSSKIVTEPPKISNTQNFRMTKKRPQYYSGPIEGVGSITPPAEEEDTKSDESGLDVHSIEQDAKKDFPIFDEYVIDPSETDDDKIEYKEREKSSDDPIPDVDTFTNRVERYKKMEETHADHVDDVFESRKSSKSFELPTSSSPAMTIASYFDTGNYAVENHYRNSLTSPSNLNSFQFITQSSLMRVPPGFEDEFQRRLSLVSNEGFLTTDKDEFAKYIPDLAYQSNLSTALTANQLALNQNNSSSVETENILDKSSEKSHSESLGELPLPQTEAKLPDFASIFDGKRESANEENQPLSSSSFSELTPEKKLEKSADPSNEVISLPHSVNLPSDKPPAVAENSDVYDFSRLSSYFSSPTQADPSKSFFELSQSQNHYRQETVPLKDSSKIASDCSIVGNTTSMSSRNNPNDKTNIPHETLVANMNLIKDLTSTANIDFIPKEQTVRTINFFTVVYDDNSLNPVSSKGESKSVKNDNSNRLNADISSSNIHELVKTSSKSDNLLFTDSSPHCCNTETETVKEIDNNLDNLGSNKVKFRKSMNGNSSDASNGIDVMEKKKDDGGHSFTVNFDNYSLQEEKEDNVTIMTENRSSGEYSPVKHHWFYRVDQEDKSVWKGFSAVDSTALENAYNSPDLDENTLVPTDGGRFDVHVVGRLRTPVYWSEKPSNVMRCSWFYRGNSDARYVPYPESVAVKLEEEYKHGIRTSEWHRRLVLPEGEVVVMHGPSVMVHFLQGSAADAFSSSPQTAVRPRVVRRGCVESEIEDGEPSKVDHLVLLCHGVGSACDMRFRPVEEVVDDFRATSLQLLQSHYKNSYDRGIVGRIEVLPVSWHSALHSGEAGVDRRLARVTLDSIPRLRSFTNDTVLDVLFYTSPVYCQTIIDTVCKELNRIYSLFKARNPSFDGGVSLGGHSLGSVILYDLLCHQTPEECPGPEKRYVNGSAGTGQPSVSYPQLIFHPDVLYALGSPIAIFECIRGVEQLGADFCLPTCKRFFNIFHPYDPIAYRIEPLINPQLKDVKPFQIPHHKGRKRMHLELKDTMARVGADIKQKLIESIRSTWSSMWRSQPPSERQLEKVVEEEMEKEQLTDEAKEEVVSDSEVQATAEMLGKLNGGRRVDYVLQEAPFEMINEYLFAMSSHVCYWESEDTMLLVLREVYSGRGVQPDGSRPQRTMTVQRTRPVLATETDDIKIIGSDCPSTSRGGF
ncbi:unnamed protein product, partial [Iphiclides podalirius]